VKPKTASFLTSEEVGVNTLACLILLLIPKNSINIDKLYRILKLCIFDNRKIIDGSDQGLINGGAGYLYSLLTIEESITEKHEIHHNSPFKRII
jgi:hypothetical protein